MRALTMIQPWATGMRRGLKTYETRSWPTKYRGPVAIHAGQKIDVEATKRLLGAMPLSFDDMPTGEIIGVVDLLECFEMTESSVRGAGGTVEAEWGDWRPGRFAWATAPLVWLGRPIPIKGSLGLWKWEPPDHVAKAVERAQRERVVVELC